ncbi:MAG: caspase family protein [Elainellaceae cyanobacterium]
MTPTRRAFLQRTVLGLASLGASQSALSLLARRYQTALAAPSPRKLALLVGINQYPEDVCDCSAFHGSALQGAVTDVELQRELLVHRFGFQASDVLALTDQQATRDGIESAFMSHLVDQARPGDVVVFHFSGLGSLVRLVSTDGGGGTTPNARQNARQKTTIRNSLVPIDGTLPTQEDPRLNDVMESTLVLLLRSLRTRQVTTVLDLSYAEPGTTILGGVRIRSRPSVPSGAISQAEQAIQQQLATQIGIGATPDKQLLSQAPGLVLAATDTNRIAAEGSWNGFSAGLFTYALTQQLWSTTSTTSIFIDLSQAAGRVEQVVGRLQQPTLISNIKVLTSTPSIASYPIKPVRPSADGVISSVDAETGQGSLWLGGLPALVLAHYSANSLMAVVEASQSNEPDAGANVTDLGWIQVKSKDGLVATVKPYRGKIPSDAVPMQAIAIQAGQLVQERLRILPKNIPLTIALDSSLERIERVDATSALAAIPRTTSVVVGEQPADYLFGKTTPSIRTTALSLDADSGGVSLQDGDLGADRVYGLFSLGRTAIPSTMLNTEEAVKTAVNRVTPQLRSLLAAKLLRLTESQASSRLGVRATLEVVAPDERIVMQHTARRSPWEPPESRLVSLLTSQGAVPTVATGSKIQYRLQNFGDRPVYCVLLGIDSDGNAIALYPSVAQRGGATAEGDPSLIQPGDTITMPPPTGSTEWRIDSPPGLAETHIVFSHDPLPRTAAAMDKAMRPSGSTRKISLLSDPLAIAKAILEDLHQASIAQRPRGLDVGSDVYALHVDRWATLSFYYRVDDAAA